jgi:hypothetical protein
MASSSASVWRFLGGQVQTRVLGRGARFEAQCNARRAAAASKQRRRQAGGGASGLCPRRLAPSQTYHEVLRVDFLQDLVDLLLQLGV